MKVGIFEEPLLEFAGGAHADIRHGLATFGPLDRLSQSSPRAVRIGLVGPPDELDSGQTWLQNARQGLAAKSSRQPRLFPAFPGFGPEKRLHADLAWDSGSVRTIRNRDISECLSRPTSEEQVMSISALYLEQIEALKDRGGCDVVLCVVPYNVLALRDLADEAEENHEARYDFHDYLKAKGMSLAVPLQLLLPSTFGLSPPRSHAKDMHQIQDEATRAWNLYVALYYKAGAVPWRMQRKADLLATCFIGISFFRTLDRSSTHTSLAEIFNERGEGVIVRGAAASESKEDRKPHLSENDARDLLATALRVYRREHRTLPARVVIHKSSRFDQNEGSGFGSAARNADIDFVDFVEVKYDSLRLLRQGNYPPLRGTHLLIDKRSVLLYTRGSVPFFETYPGAYVPKPVLLRAQTADTSALSLAREVLSLTKMNWNNTQFDGSLPITIRASRQVGKLLRYLNPCDPIETRYSFYM